MGAPIGIGALFYIASLSYNALCLAPPFQVKAIAGRWIGRVQLLVMVAAVAASIAFWSYYAYLSYTHFTDAFFDIGQPAYNMYYVLHYLPLSDPLQFLAYAQHIAIDQLLVLPAFAVYQSSLTLLFVQAAVVSLTGLLVFYITVNLTGSGKVGLILGMAYLASPAVTGLLVFDYHAEFLIAPFFMLTFYFYMRKRWSFFMPSLLLLLLAIDTVVPIVFTLGLGLLYYEAIYRRNNRVDAKRIKMALSIVILSGLFFLFYAAVQTSLLIGYGTGAYSTPLYLKVVPYEPVLLDSLLGRQAVAIPYFNTSTYPVLLLALGRQGVLSDPPVLVFGLFAGLLILVPLVLVDPLLTAIIDLPWLAELLSGHLLFGEIGNQYLSYVICGTLVSATLGFLLMKERRGVLSIIGFMRGRGKAALSRRSTLFMSFMIAAVFSMSMAAYTVLHQVAFAYMLSGASQGRAQCIAQLNSILGRVPQNSSVLSQAFVFPHLAGMEHTETFEDYGPYFNATYAVVDSGSCMAANYGLGWPNYSAGVQLYLNRNGYQLYMQNGSASLYRRAS